MELVTMDVSVIVPTRNSVLFLAEALASVRKQGAIEIDLLVVDAGSTDDSQSIAESFGAKILLQEGEGLSDAWNLGVRAARSRYIAFLDSDDVWVPDTLAPRVQILSENPELGICVGGVLHVLAEGVRMPSGFKSELFERDLVAPIPGTMVIDRRVFDQIGPFDTTVETAGDSDWVARAVNEGIKFHSFDKLVLKKRVHQNNITLDAVAVNAELLKVLRWSIHRKRSLLGKRLP